MIAGMEIENTTLGGSWSQKLHFTTHRYGGGYGRRMTINEDGDVNIDNTLTVSISADGTNYETVTDATIHRFTNTGTNLYVKFEIDRVDTAAVDKISEYAILYNLNAS